MQIGNSIVDFDALLVDGPAGHFSMEPKVMDLLRVLVDNHNTVMTREELIEAVWGVEFGGDERLSRGISLLRKALGDARGQHTHIETIPRKGYRLIAALGDAPAAPNPTIDIAPIALTGTHPMIEAPAIVSKRSFPVRAFAIFGVMFAVAIGAWISPLGKSIQEIPQNRKVEVGLEYIKNFTEKDAIPQAQVLFAGMLADNPDHAAARAGMALALMREYTHLESDPALLQRARATAEAALRADKHLALANIAVGWAAEYEGDFEKAHKSYDRADMLDPDNLFTLEGRARTFHTEGKPDEALDALDKGISLYPQYSVYYFTAGDILAKQDKYAHAEAMFRHTITLTNDNPRAYAQLAYTLHYQDRTTEAIRVLQDGLEVNETALLYSNLGAWLFFQGQYEVSAEAFERAIDLAGNSHDYLYWANLADAYRWVPGRKPDAYGAYDRALQLLQIELEKWPKNSTILSRAALYNSKRGNLELAQQFLNRIPFSTLSSASVYYRAAVTQEILDNRTLALSMLDRALEAGYPRTEIFNDPELTNLRQDPDYHRLLASKESKL